MNNLNLSVSNWNQNIPKKYLCPKYGLNESPTIKWSPVNNCKSYAFIIQDLNEVSHNFIHWYIPSINPSVESILSLKNNKNISSSPSELLTFYENNPNIPVKQGLNTSTSFGYHGPCAPKDTGDHEYVFYFYALDNDIFKVLNEKKNQFSNDYNNLFKPKTKSELEQLIKNLNINILAFTTHSGFFNPSSLTGSGKDSDYDSSFSNENDEYDDDDDDN